MRRALFAVIALLAAGVAAAQDADRTHSPECRKALDALQAQEAKATPDAPAKGEALKELQALRKQAARACLGGTGNPPPPSPNVSLPPPTLPPPAVRLPPRPAAPPIAPPVTSAAPVRPAPVVTGCDSTGCWTSDGSRLPRLGPGVIGPRGFCTVNGVEVHCP